MYSTCPGGNRSGASVSMILSTSILAVSCIAYITVKHQTEKMQATSLKAYFSEQKEHYLQLLRVLKQHMLSCFSIFPKGNILQLIKLHINYFKIVTMHKDVICAQLLAILNEN